MPAELTPLRLELLRKAQDLIHDAAEALGGLKLADVPQHAATLQLSAVLDKVDNVEALLDEALEMGE